MTAFLWALRAILSPTSGWTFPWPIFPTLGWGIGVATNAWDVHGRRDITAADVDREMRGCEGAEPPLRSRERVASRRLARHGTARALSCASGQCRRQDGTTSTIPSRRLTRT